MPGAGFTMNLQEVVTTSRARGPYRSSTWRTADARPARRLRLVMLALLVAVVGAGRRATAPGQAPSLRPPPPALRDVGPLRPLEGAVALVAMYTPQGEAIVARVADGSLRRLMLDPDVPREPALVAQRALAAPFVCTPRGGDTHCVPRRNFLPSGDSYYIRVTRLDGGRVRVVCGGPNEEHPWSFEGTSFVTSERVLCLRTDDGLGRCFDAKVESYESGRSYDASCEEMADQVFVTATPVQGIAVSGAEVCAWTAAGALECIDLRFDHDGSVGVSSHAIGTLAGIDRVWLGGARGALCARDGRGRVWCRGAWVPAADEPVSELHRLDGFAPDVPLREVPELAGAETIEWGGNSCALLPRGRVACWGWNQRGEIPDGRAYRRIVPARAEGVADAVDLSAGRDHACAVRLGGRVACWGDNEQGQLGDGTRVPRGTPREVALPEPAAQVAAGAEHTCARTAAGGVWCWGEGDHGALGDGAGRDARSPVRVGALDRAVELAAGDDHTCARTSEGAVYCWGRFGCGWPGHAQVHGSLRPLRVTLAGQAVAVRSLGEFACAELATGGVRCWGMRDNQMWPEATTGRCPAVEVTFAPRHETLAGRPSSWTSSDLRDSGVREVVPASVADAVAVAEGVSDAIPPSLR